MVFLLLGKILGEELLIVIVELLLVLVLVKKVQIVYIMLCIMDMLAAQVILTL